MKYKIIILFLNMPQNTEEINFGDPGKLKNCNVYIIDSISEFDKKSSYQATSRSF